MQQLPWDWDTLERPRLTHVLDALPSQISQALQGRPAEFETPGEAIELSRGICQNQHSEQFIHGRDGRIRERNSYGRDPFPPPG